MFPDVFVVRRKVFIYRTGKSHCSERKWKALSTDDITCEGLSEDNNRAESLNLKSDMTSHVAFYVADLHMHHGTSQTTQQLKMSYCMIFDFSYSLHVRNHRCFFI